VEIDGLPLGAIVGTVRVTGCRFNAALQCYEWHLADAVAFPAPVPFRKGQLGLFEVSEHLLPE